MGRQEGRVEGKEGGWKESVTLTGYLITQTQSFAQLTDSYHEGIEHTEYTLGDTHQ